MRIRTIKPEFWSHEGIAEMEPIARLLFIGLWNMADRRGRLEDRPKRIKVQVLPYDDVDIDTLLTELHMRDFITRYSVGELQVIQINGFEKHQRISGKEAEIESELPGITGEAIEKQRGSTGEAPEKHPGAQEGKGKERKGMERNGVGENVGGNRLPTTVKEHLSDDQWIESLQASEAYKTLNVREQVAKCAEWCAVNGKQCSRRRVVNWLNRADRPMAGRAISGSANGIPVNGQKSDGGGNETILGKYL